MSENKTMEALLDPENSEATAELESEVSDGAEIDNMDASSASLNADRSEEKIDNAQLIDSAALDTDTDKDSVEVETTDEGTETFTDIEGGTDESTVDSSDDLKFEDDEEIGAVRRMCARVPIKVYVHPNEKSRFYETTGTYHLVGEKIISCFQPVICSVRGIGRVEGYIKVNGGR